MLVLDTCALVFDALVPERLSQKARNAIEQADREGKLACCDISFWEIAMLVDRGRLDPGTDTVNFIRLMLASRRIRVLPITAEIAHISTTLALHPDPADRLIAAAAIVHRGKLVTTDRKLLDAEDVPTLR